MSRSQYKGPYFKTNLIQNTKILKNTWTKIYNKNLIILSQYVNKVFRIYNGKIFISLKINSNMVGYKFGEFVYTRKKHVYKKKKK